MRVALSKFVCDGIETQLGSDVPGGVRMALFHYASKLKTGRKPIPLPRFLADRAPADPELVFDLIVDPETEAVLERESSRQETTMERLVGHAVFVYLAELEFLGASPREQRRAPSARPQAAQA